MARTKKKCSFKPLMCRSSLHKQFLIFFATIYALTKSHTSFFFLSYASDITSAIHVVDEAKKMDFSSLWLECDSTLVCVPFTARTNVP